MAQTINVLSQKWFVLMSLNKKFDGTPRSLDRGPNLSTSSEILQFFIFFWNNCRKFSIVMAICPPIIA